MAYYTFFYLDSDGSDYKMYMSQSSAYSIAVSHFISFFRNLKSSYKSFAGFYHHSSVTGTIVDCMDKDDFDTLLSLARSSDENIR